MTHEEKVEVIRGLITIRESVKNGINICLDHYETIDAALKELTHRVQSFKTQDDKPTCKDKPDTQGTCVDCSKRLSIDDMWCPDCIKTKKVIDGKCYRTIFIQSHTFGPILMDSICYREDLDPLVDCMISIRLCPKLMQEVIDFYNDLPREDIEKLSVFWRIK